MTPLVKVSHLSKSFGVRRKILQAVHDLSFHIMPGEILGLAGESGCGKSTVGKLLVRLIEPSAGSIVFDGQDLCTLTARAFKPLRPQIQMIFQNPSSSLNPRFTV